jgi:radical SAM superfamily enzyme YgiQ (UPF0313 family)
MTQKQKGANHPNLVKLISFDCLADNEPQHSYAVALIHGTLLLNPKIRDHFQIDRVCNPAQEFNSIAGTHLSDDTLMRICGIQSLNELQHIKAFAFGSYIWSETFVLQAIQFLRKVGYEGTIIVGGYQITYKDNNHLAREYPEVDFFLKGYVENTIAQAILSERPIEQQFINQVGIDVQYVAAYSSGLIPVEYQQGKIRIETKRNCPYRCSFCQHTSPYSRKPTYIDLEGVIEELDYLNSQKVRKINFLDPVFYIGCEREVILLEELSAMNMQSTLSFQMYFDLLGRTDGNWKAMNERFLKASRDLNVVFEFGLQTIHPAELEIIERKNELAKVKTVMQQLNDLGIHYEISLIYGLPKQTVSSLEDSIAFCQKNGCQSIVVFPLMLYPGTKLYDQKVNYQIKESTEGDYSIPYVVESDSFTYQEWQQMKEIADSLPKKDGRID